MTITLDDIKGAVGRVKRERLVSPSDFITEARRFPGLDGLIRTGYRDTPRAGTPKRKAVNNVKFCDLEWRDGNHIKGKVRDDTDRVIGTFTVELFAGMGTIPKESIKETRKEHVMRNLYFVFVVDPQEDTVDEALVISKSPDGAKFKALTDLQKELKKDIDEYDILVVPQGHVRDKKEVQEVKLVTD
jgi:hypothetical protein